MSKAKLSKKELIELVLLSFSAEKNHDIKSNYEYLHEDFAVTDMIVDQNDKPFPRLSGKKLEESINEAFIIEGREFYFPNILADEESQTVMVEFVESYPDPETKKVYRTPQVAICKIKDGKIFRTRHYMDPRLSYKYLDDKKIKDALE